MCISLYVSESWSVGENDSRLGNVCVREKEREKVCALSVHMRELKRVCLCESVREERESQAGEREKEREGVCAPRVQIRIIRGRIEELLR